MKIAGSNILVTGGASGLGLAFARHLAGCGARVWALDRDADALRARAEEAAGSGGKIAFEHCDVGVEEDVVATVWRIVSAAERIDVLVNNAAVLRDQALASKLGGKIRKHALSDWNETIRSNLTGTFLMAREVAASMMETRHSGLIVNVSSVSRHGNAGQSAYAASKSAVDALTKTWARELAVYGIRVAAIAPGFVPTPMTDGIPPMFLDQIREKTPLKRFGTLEEFTATIQYVIENDYLNGTILEVDGGLQF